MFCVLFLCDDMTAVETASCCSCRFSPLPPQGKLCLHNDCDGTEHVFTLRGVGEPPLPVDQILLSCPVGKTTYAEINVPNYSQTKLTLRVSLNMPLFCYDPCWLCDFANHKLQYTW